MCGVAICLLFFIAISQHGLQEVCAEEVPDYVMKWDYLYDNPESVYDYNYVTSRRTLGKMHKLLIRDIAAELYGALQDLMSRRRGTGVQEDSIYKQAYMSNDENYYYSGVLEPEAEQDLPDYYKKYYDYYNSNNGGYYNYNYNDYLMG